MGAELPWEGVPLCWDVKAEDQCPFGSDHLWSMGLGRSDFCNA